MFGRLVAGLILFMVSGRSAQLPLSYFRGEPLRIGNQVQLLADDYIVEDRWKPTREVGKVMKHMRNPVLVPDKPWEGATPGAPDFKTRRPLGKRQLRGLL